MKEKKKKRQEKNKYYIDTQSPKHNLFPDQRSKNLVLYSYANEIDSSLVTEWISQPPAGSLQIEREHFNQILSLYNISVKNLRSHSPMLTHLQVLLYTRVNTERLFL